MNARLRVIGVRQSRRGRHADRSTKRLTVAICRYAKVVGVGGLLFAPRLRPGPPHQTHRRTRAL